MQTLEKLIDLLTLERIDDRFFRGQNYQAPWKRVYGGQVLGQGLHAAYQTVPEDRIAHSLHGYFILPGDISVPVLYEVDMIRDGGSFTTRRVAAIQKGKTIFIMAVSFQKQQEGFDHQISIPEVESPATVETDIEQYKILEKINPKLYKRFTGIHPNVIEFRPVERFNPMDIKSEKPFKNVWIRSKEKTDLDLPMQQQILAYASDYNLLTTATLPHRPKINPSKMFMASLDHAIWFHRDFRMDDWLLYALDSPSASNARGFSRGNIFSEDGKLIASVVQEGLIRQKD